MENVQTSLANNSSANDSNGFKFGRETKHAIFMSHRNFKPAAFKDVSVNCYCASSSEQKDKKLLTE